MKITHLGVVTLSMFMLTSCGSGGEKSFPSGLMIKIVDDQKGENVDTNQFVWASGTVAVTTKAGTDSVVINTAADGDPMIFKVLDSDEQGGMYRALMLLSQGDSAEFTIPVDSFFAGSAMGMVPPFIKPGSTVKYALRINKVQDEASFEADYKKFQAEKEAGKVAEEANAIQNYISSNNLKTTKTESGVHYLVTKAGNGPEVEEGDEVEVLYVGKLLDGSIFDASERHNNEPLKFTVGAGMIEGFSEGVSNLRGGDKATIIIPFSLGYGAAARGPELPAFSTLVFEVEVLKVTKSPLNKK